MKTEQEQIEEIAFSSCVVPHNTIQFLSNYMQKESIKFESCRVCEFYNSCQRIKDIKNLYKAGYRKQSEVAKEFVDRLILELIALRSEEFDGKELAINGKTYKYLVMRAKEIAAEYGVEVEE